MQIVGLLAAHQVLRTTICRSISMNSIFTQQQLRRPTNHLRSSRCSGLRDTSAIHFNQNRPLTSDSTLPEAKEVKKEAGNQISVTFLKPDGGKSVVKVESGKSLYDAVIDNNIDIDGFGACEGTLCCTTCHLIFNEVDFAKVGGPSDEEIDMLDLAYGLTETSRLGCQVILKQEFNPLEVQVPASITDVREC